MIFKFGKGRKLSDLTKLAEYLEKEGIEYDLITDINLLVGGMETEANQPQDYVAPRPIEDSRVKMTEQDNDPLWRNSPICSTCGGTGIDGASKCLAPGHYGGELLT